MKNTFLVFIDPTNPSSGLRVATSAEWHQILNVNRSLPREQRRFFITDSFEDCGEIDCMYIEATREDYNKWHVQYQEAYRKRKCGEGCSVQSLSDPIPGTEEDLELEDTISTGFNLEISVTDSILLDELRRALAKWNDWANELLDYYLVDKYSACTKELVEKWGVSKVVIAKRKRQLNAFIENFIS